MARARARAAGSGGELARAVARAACAHEAGCGKRDGPTGQVTSRWTCGSRTATQQAGSSKERQAGGREGGAGVSMASDGCGQVRGETDVMIYVEAAALGGQVGETATQGRAHIGR